MKNKIVRACKKVVKNEYVKIFAKGYVKTAIIYLCMSTVVNSIFGPDSIEYKNFMNNDLNSNNITLENFDEVATIKERGTIYLENEFKVKYDVEKNEYKLFTIYNPNVGMNFDSSKELIKAINKLSSVNEDDYTISERDLALRCLFNRKEKLVLNSGFIEIDGDIKVSIFELDKETILVELIVLNKSYIQATIERKDLDKFIDDLFSARDLKTSEYTSLVTDGSQNEDLIKKINKNGEVYPSEKMNGVTERIISKELGLVPNKLMEKISQNSLREIVSNGSALESINETGEYFDYRIGGYYSYSDDYILVGSTENNIKWALLHEVGHAFDALEGLSRNVNVYLSYKKGEVFFNNNYAYMNIREYVAETFVLKMRGLLDEESIINKEYDKILNKYQ